MDDQDPTLAPYKSAEPPPHCDSRGYYEGIQSLLLLGRQTCNTRLQLPWFVHMTAAQKLLGMKTPWLGGTVMHRLQLEEGDMV